MNEIWRRLVDRGTPCPHGHIAGGIYCGKCQASVEAELAREELMTRNTDKE